MGLKCQRSGPKRRASNIVYRNYRHYVMGEVCKFDAFRAVRTARLSRHSVTTKNPWNGPRVLSPLSLPYELIMLRDAKNHIYRLWHSTRPTSTITSFARRSKVKIFFYILTFPHQLSTSTFHISFPHTYILLHRPNHEISFTNPVGFHSTRQLRSLQQCYPDQERPSPRYTGL